MMQKEITLERLAGILDAYGASPSRWPADERAAVEGLLAASAEARALLAAASRFDTLLDMAPAEAPSEALVARLMAARPRALPQAPAPAPARGFLRSLVDAVWPYGSPALPAGTLAASIMLGIMLGSVTDISLPTTSNTAVAATLDTTAAGDEFISLALADTVWPEDWMQ
ncbi:conserved hypothetical protein [Parvibaculum lavamentivorans DS-1]|uniref:Uncharacterized protein n=1 Tax=Parvibaculum lavamentivorans (strain DS-1 / DSM 13023 / NCIMB 13966) TaxID=402881 RepID=A7HRP2_PARL1|nr:hypothetical protein [Parvibaculum lavamentivorans]ABS62575.1 conserved hypothetical protein [Parvibaculum lavamentivorans DS-1]